MITLKIPKKDDVFYDGQRLTNGHWLLDLSVIPDFKLNGEFGGLVKARKPFCYRAQNKNLSLEMPRKGIAEGIVRMMSDAENALSSGETKILHSTKILLDSGKQVIRVLRNLNSLTLMDEMYYQMFAPFVFCQQDNALLPIILRAGTTLVGLCLPVKDLGLSEELKTIFNTRAESLTTCSV